MKLIGHKMDNYTALVALLLKLLLEQKCGFIKGYCIAKMALLLKKPLAIKNGGLMANVIVKMAPLLKE